MLLPILQFPQSSPLYIDWYVELRCLETKPNIQLALPIKTPLFTWCKRTLVIKPNVLALNMQSGSASPGSNFLLRFMAGFVFP